MNLKLKNLSAVFSRVMSLVYVAAGIFLIIYNPESLAVNKTFRVIFGILLLVYGLFRSYRAFKSLKEEDEQ